MIISRNQVLCFRKLLSGNFDLAEIEVVIWDRQNPLPLIQIL